MRHPPILQQLLLSCLTPSGSRDWRPDADGTQSLLKTRGQSAMHRLAGCVWLGTLSAGYTPWKEYCGHWCLLLLRRQSHGPRVQGANRDQAAGSPVPSARRKLCGNLTARDTFPAKICTARKGTSNPGPTNSLNSCPALLQSSRTLCVRALLLMANEP